MNRSLLTQLYWVIPGVFVVFGLALLFYQNYLNVTEPPEKDWSRALFVGQTDVNKLPPIKEMENGDFAIARYEDEKLASTILSKDFVVKEKKTYDIPVDKWTQIYMKEDTIIYFKSKNIYDKNKNEMIPDVERFYPLDSTILYIKENVLYQLIPETWKSKAIMDIDLNKLDITPQENKDGIHILVYTRVLNGVDITLNQLNKGEMKTIYQSNIPVDPGKVVNEISFTFNGQKLALLLQEELEQTQGKPEFFNYFMETTVTSQGSQPLYELTFQDPAGTNNLTEVSDVILNFSKGKSTLLFQANGLTKTQYNDNTTFNIYKAEINENGIIKTERRSNTPAISTNPQWVNEETIAWLDLNPDGNQINISSGDLDTINQLQEFNQDDWLRALGKTLGMVTSAFFAILISFVWFIWPILFIMFLYIFRSRIIDHDPTWIFYTGVGIYALAAFVWKDQFFVNNIYTNAPEYLTFNGSSYVYMFMFAIIALWLTMLTKRVNEWNGTLRVMYFVGTHILLLTAFFGPYVI